ncbi:hypothetical protein N0V88_004714 [Collariella sp. IMI 366227]|nr:hypothetical protein N0V88_004714 [Collariella sp. IMI 366227]
MDSVQRIQTLTESFLALSNEVQSLVDRKTILEHKLRYAHEQYQCLADKYAPAVPEVSETLAKLQLPPDLQYPPATATSAVPLPRRSQAGSSQHQIALLIREGRRAAQQLVADIVYTEKERDGTDRDQSHPPGMETLTAVSTVLEKDFTIEGKKGFLACPFSVQPNQDGGLPNGAVPVDGPQDRAAAAADPTPHQSSDPICAAMLDETSAQPDSAAPPKCPIRFLDKHSPEEIAHYVETHKHAIPRSHEVCVRRYQRNEEQIRKLDAKYGNLVSMVKDLSHLHRPMMPPSKEEEAEADRVSNKRVEDWAQTVVAGDPDVVDPDVVGDPDIVTPGVDEERENRFDRSLRDVRLGESPSRPWGIQVPLEASAVPQREPSLPRPAPKPVEAPKEPAAPRKCPFDHTKMFPGAVMREDVAASIKPEDTAHAVKQPRSQPQPQPAMPPKNDVPPSGLPPQPTFVNLPPVLAPTDKGERPQVVFNISGPVFIGYPMEQAMELMKQWQRN